MATNWINTVPQGQIGTGNAQVFGVNPLAGQFAQQLGDLRQRQQIEAEKLAKAWRENQLAASSGRLWAKDMTDIERDFINRGIELQQRGIDPYGSSQDALDYQRDKRYVEAQQGYRKGVEDQFNKLMVDINRNPDKYDKESIKMVNDFVANTNLQDAFTKNLMLPQLTERFDAAKFLEPIKANLRRDKKVVDGMTVEEQVIDVPTTQNAILSRLSQDPRGVKLIQDMTSGFSVPEVRGFAPTYGENLVQVREEIMNNEPIRLQLAATEKITPGTQEMEEYISDQAALRTNARKKFDDTLRGYVDAAARGLTTFKTETPYRDPNIPTPIQRERLELDKQKFRRLLAKDAKEVADKGEGNVRKEWIQQIKNWEPNALEKLVAYGNANGEYDKNDSFRIIKHVRSDGTESGPRLHVPAKTRIVDGVPQTISQAHDYEINQSDPNFETYMNQLIGDITGARVDIGSVGAKSSNLKTSPPNTPVQTAAPKAAAGYSSVRTVRDPKGNVITIGVKNGKWFDTKTGKEIK